MVISKTQFCVDLLTEYFNPGGALFAKSQISFDEKRPLVKAKFTNGFRIQDNGKVEIELNNINFIPGDNLFVEDCFEFNCFIENGIFTNVESVSDICTVEFNGSNTEMSASQRDIAGLSCFINTFGKKNYFVRGTIDQDGFVYLADIGTVNPISGNFIVIESNVSFFSRAKPHSLFASITNIGVGIKAARIKKVNSTSVEILGIIYGQLENEFYFPHNILQKNLSYTAQGQTLSLENTSINLLLLTAIRRFLTIPNQIIYRNINYSTPTIENILIKSGEILQDLILTNNVAQQYSLPKNITTFLNHQDQYNINADDNYSNLVGLCFDANCFEPGCFEEIVNNSLIDRSISNRSLAWTILFLSSYSINYNIDLEDSIIQLLSYLIQQKDNELRLYNNGWNQIEEECVELTTEDDLELITEEGVNICLEGDEVLDTSTDFLYSLEKDTNIYTSTNVSIFMALLKGFELTQNFDYLIEAEELYVAIYKYLVNTSNLFQHSLIESQSSIESVTYQFILNLILEDYGNIFDIITFFKSRLSTVDTLDDEPVEVGVDDVLVGSDLVFLTPENLNIENYERLLFNLTPVDTISDVDDIFKYNYLIYSSFIFLNNKIPIDFINIIQSEYTEIENLVIQDRERTALIFAIGCLINNNSFLGFENIKFNTLIDFYNYKFQKELTFNKFLNSLPSDYGWFNPDSLNRNSTIGSIGFSLCKILGRTFAESEFLSRISSIDNMYGILLNTKAEDYNLTRFNKETDQYFRARIKSEIFNRALNKEDIKNKLALFNSEVIINDNYKAVQAYESFENNLYNYKWNQGYTQGVSLYNTNISTFTFFQPIESDVYIELQRLKPAGAKLDLIETFTFNIGIEIGIGTGSLVSTVDGSTSIIITDIEGACDNLDLETSGDILTEVGNRLCLEDEDTLLLPVNLNPPILPPLDNPIITEDPDACDCLNLRGYITLNNIITEVRNMRIVNITDYDVNISNDTGPTCDLKIKSSLSNITEEFLEVQNDTIFNLPINYNLRAVNLILDSPITNQLYTFVTLEDTNLVQSNTFIVREDPSVSLLEASSLTGTTYDVAQTDNYLFISEGTNLYYVNKTIFGSIDTISFSPPTEVNSFKLIPLSNETIGIYSYDTTDNNIYFYIWEENTPTLITAGTTVNLGTSYTSSYYFNFDGALHRLTKGSTTDIYRLSNFDELGTLAFSLNSILPDINSLLVIDNLIYINDINISLPNVTTNIYQNFESLVRLNYNDTSLKQLQYLDSYIADFDQVAKLFRIGSYILSTGSNKAYNLSSNQLDFINNLNCMNDTTEITSGYIVQAIGYVDDYLLVTAVDLITGDWLRYRVQNVNKVC